MVTLKLLIGRRFLVPYLRPFPVLTYCPVLDFFTGVPTGEWAWLPNWYGQREISREEAERLAAE